MSCNQHFCFLDPYGSGGQKFPPLGGGGGIGYEANPGVPPATMSGSMMGSDMVMYLVGRSTKEILIFTTYVCVFFFKVGDWTSFSSPIM